MSDLPSSNPIEAQLIKDTQKVRDIAAKTPEEHLEDASTQAKIALGNLKLNIEQGPPTDFDELKAKGELQNETTAAGVAALDALMKAGLSGIIQMEGGHMVYEPGKGVHWEASKPEAGQQ